MRRLKRIVWRGIWALIVWVLVVGVYGVIRPLPEGIGLAGEVHSIPTDSVAVFVDRTYIDAEGVRHSQQEIFDEVFRMITEAEHYVLVDFFLFNEFIGTETSSYRELSRELTEVLIAKKQSNPEIAMQIITDPINAMYGGQSSRDLTTLAAHDIPVVVTDLRPLRDSNPLYSAWWRVFFQWFGNTSSPGWLPHPLDMESQKLSFRTYLTIFNYKANHRKVVITDYARGDDVGLSVLTTSANPHDGSSAHSNIAVRIDKGLWHDALASERAVAAFSNAPFSEPPTELLQQIESDTGPLQAQLLTEGAIAETVLARISVLEAGDRLDMAMFYIADRSVIIALKRADERGVQVRLLLDPNKDAFGREKNGSPNRQVAHELMQHTNGNTKLRWCDTHGEQCHSKLLLLRDSEGYALLQGSANLTRRNLDNFNLETNVLISNGESFPAFEKAQQFFEQTWSNEEDRFYSVDYSVYEDTSFLRTLSYRLKEFTGVSRW